MRHIYSFLAVALLGLMVLTACNSAEQKISNTGPIAPPSTTSRAVPTDGIRRITVVELRDLVAKDEVAIIDVRNEAAYKVGHIRGAKLIPVGETLNHISELPKDKLIVTYCS